MENYYPGGDTGALVVTRGGFGDSIFCPDVVRGGDLGGFPLLLPTVSIRDGEGRLWRSNDLRKLLIQFIVALVGCCPRIR